MKEDIDFFSMLEDYDECPTCKKIPTLDGETPGCYDPEGCFKSTYKRMKEEADAEN